MVKKKVKKKYALGQCVVAAAAGSALTYGALEYDLDGAGPTHFTRYIESRYGLPITSPHIFHNGYMLAYDGREKSAHWVLEEVRPENFKEKSERSSSFSPESKVPEHLRAQDGDYAKSGYDRGHLAPAANYGNPKAKKDTFCYSNVCPQVPALNRGFWKNLETEVRKLSHEYERLFVISGPLYKANKGSMIYPVIGAQNVGVPTHFFKILLGERADGAVETSAYLVPNSKEIKAKEPFEKYRTTVQEIERHSGTLFFPKLSI